MSRKIAREVAMKLAFCELFGGEDTYEDVLDKSGIEEKPTAEDVAFAGQVVDGIDEHLQEIDALISDLAIGWTIDRLPKVDLTILRVAIFEIIYLNDMPYRVSINEAVELAKTFAGDQSPSYINGMLGTLVRRMNLEGA